MAEQQFGEREAGDWVDARRGDAQAALSFRRGLATGWRSLGVGAVFEREMERGRGALWLPALFGIGVLLYFGLPREPSGLALLAVTIAVAAVAILGRGRAARFRLCLALAAVLAGTTTMKLRTDWVAAPIVVAEYTGDLTGWVERLERMGPREVRLVVRVQSLEDLGPAETPRKVRITARGAFDGVRVGDGIAGLVGLQPPAAPVMPGGYDFGRELYYQGIGASGFSYGPPGIVDLGPPPFGVAWRIPIERLRQSVGARIETALPGDIGQIANALVTGDRGGISEDATVAFRASGLAHILSISGLHMALVAGAVFGFLRGLFALSQTLALRRPIKKWAAGGALGVAAFYLLMSGGDVATQRSFIMLAVMLIAVLLDRRAFSIRNIAVAAAIVLVLSPEAILTASFQMSFAATLALIVGFEVVDERRRKRPAIGPAPGRTMIRAALFAAAGLLLTSILAGLATAPFGAFHFNRTQPLSLVANLAAMPFVSLLVMPFALIAVVLMPFGLEQWPLEIMGFGLRMVIAIADRVTEWTGSAGMVPASPLAALLVAVAGLLWLCLWGERWRLLGGIAIAGGLALFGSAPRPDVLIEETGAAVAVRGPDGAYRFMGRGATFELETWLRADADPRAAGHASLEEGVFCDPLGCTAPLGGTGLRVALVEEPRAFAEDCRVAAIVITALAAPEGCAAFVVDRRSVQRYGVHALFIDGANEGRVTFRVATVRPDIRRPWMPPLAH